MLTIKKHSIKIETTSIHWDALNSAPGLDLFM